AHPHVYLMLMYLMMAVMDGVSVLKDVRELAPETAVVVVTGYPYYQGADGLFSDGAFEFVVKPVDIDYLEQIVRVSLLVKHQSRAKP
ncbi:MAG: response regulator, partial [Candidatus Omnitrophica bacterium]|nr:response regulator [Candidatus Omnitrophota bacterium]